MITNQSIKSIRKKLVKVDTPQLLKEISKRPILFDSKVKDFKKYNLRTKEWAQLGNLFNIKGSEAKIRWRSVRDGFLRHIRRTESNDSERGNWIYYDEMAFFIPHILSRKRKTTNNCDDPVCDDSVSNEFIQANGNQQVHSQEEFKQHDTEHMNDDSCYDMLVESLDHQEEITDDDEFNEAGRTSGFVQQDEHIGPERLETFGAPGMKSPTTVECDDSYNASDDNEKFLLSCVPTLRRLDIRKNMLARIRIQKVLFDLEFNEND